MWQCSGSWCGGIMWQCSDLTPTVWQECGMSPVNGQAINHPILGDPSHHLGYRLHQPASSMRAPNTALHCNKLRFVIPVFHYNLC